MTEKVFLAEVIAGIYGLIGEKFTINGILLCDKLETLHR